ncbi:LCP family protein [Agreia pratensis]|uniref:LCP family protein n=1 Tax=Agreia pratensis TaxID=150121 RepID=UPI001889CC7B|nr:LCP family protein [Agreia pratensis]MBF4635269.1 LCP family protein [Agreia pratensis]
MSATTRESATSSSLGRALAAIVLDVVVPGSGHLLVGVTAARRILLCATTPAVAAVIAAAITAVLDPAWLAGLLAGPGALTVLSLVALVWCAVILATVAHLVRHLVRRPLPFRAVVATATVAALLGAGAFAGAAAVTDEQSRRVDALFADGAGLEATDGRINILLVGADTAPDRSATMPDSISIVSVDASTGRTVVIGIPRSTINFPFPAGSALASVYPEGNFCSTGCNINHSYLYGQEHPELFPDSDNPAMAALTEAVTGYTGLSISAFVVVKMQGFVQLVDALGGVEIDVKKPVPRTGVPNAEGDAPTVAGGDIPAGVQRMDGETALWFARSRFNSSDSERLQRQGCLQRALFSQSDPVAILRIGTGILDAGDDLIVTDIPRASLGRLGELAVRAKNYPLGRIELDEPRVNPLLPDLDFVARLIAAALAEKPLPDPPSLFAPTPEETSDGTSGSGSPGEPTGNGSTAEDEAIAVSEAVCAVPAGD